MSMAEELIDKENAVLDTRISGPITVRRVVDEVAENYDLGDQKPEHVYPLPRGLESKKFTFWAGNKCYLLKTYDDSSSRPPRFRLRNLSALEGKLEETGIPFAKTIATKDDRSFVPVEARVTPGTNYHTAVFVSEVFTGRALQNPTVEDVEAIVGYMTRIHQIKDYGVVPAMDSWSLLRLVQTYDSDVNDRDLQMVLTTIRPVVDSVRALDMDDKSKFPKTLAHGDLHPFNILKGGENDYCILDLGCMDHEQRIADLAIFMSMTCADFTNKEKTIELFNAAVAAYEKSIKLTLSERKALPLLIKANYAMFALRTAELLRENPDDAEVKQFHEHGMQGLKFMGELDWK